MKEVPRPLVDVQFGVCSVPLLELAGLYRLVEAEDFIAHQRWTLSMLLGRAHSEISLPKCDAELTDLLQELDEAVYLGCSKCREIRTTAELFRSLEAEPGSCGVAPNFITFLRGRFEGSIADVPFETWLREAGLDDLEAAKEKLRRMGFSVD